MGVTDMTIRPLHSNLQKLANGDLNEVPKRTKEDIENIKTWVLQQSYLRARIDDQWIVSFLRGCKFSIQRTKEKFDLFYTMRTLLPEFFKNRDPLQADIQDVLKRGIIVVLPSPPETPQPTIVIVRSAKADPEKVLFLTGLKVAFMMMDILLLESDPFIVCGQRIIVDMEGLSYKYILQMTPSIMKKAIICLQNAYPTRPQGIHSVHAPSYFEPIHKLISSLISKKIQGRVFFHNNDNMKDLYKHIPISRLPTEYGGQAGSMDDIAEDWKLKVESYRDWFLEDAKYYSEEAKRPGKGKSSAEMFGVEGSFRKLDID